jgi:hypothetical protein
VAVSNQPPRAILELERQINRALELQADTVRKVASRVTPGSAEERRLVEIEQSLRRLADELKTPRE